MKTPLGQEVTLPHDLSTISPQHLWAVLNASPSGMALLHTLRNDEGEVVDFRYVLANHAHAQLIGQRYEYLPGKCVSEFLPSLTDHPFFTLLANAVRTQQPGELEMPYQADGIDGWFALRVRPNGDELMASYDDVTAIRRAQQETDRRAQELQVIFDASINSIVAMTAIRDEQGEITDFWMDLANEAVFKSNFMTPEQVVGKRLLELFPGNVDNGFFDLYKRVVNTGEPGESVQYYKDEYGLEGWFEVSAVRLGEQQVVVTYNNVTGIKRQELELHRAVDHLKQVNDSALAAIASYSAIREKGVDGQPGRIIDFIFESFSKTAEEITGLRAEDIIGGRMLVMFPTVGMSGLFEKWVQLVETGEPVRFTDHYAGEGIDFWFDTKAVKWGDGFIQSYIDVSGSVNYQRSLEHANEVLRKANENLQQFAFVASHDLQEPLRKIITMSDLLTERHTAVLGDGVDLLNRMNRAAHRMTALVKDLLAYSRLATPELNREPVDLNQTIRDVLIDIEQTVTERGAVFDVAPLPTVEADCRQVQQLMQNLLTNAVKYVAEGTTPHVVIRSSLRTAEAVKALMPHDTGIVSAGNYQEISIADNGIGFRPEHRERIFGTFQRLHTATSQYEGTGIGLAIVKRVADNHGALITADSEEGQGATFRVFWPV